MSNDETKLEDGQIPAKCSWDFTKKAAELIAPSEKTQERQAKEVMEQINIAGLAAVATGKPCSIVITLEMKDGLAEGFQSEITGDALQELAKMDESQIITALVPQLVRKCSAGNGIPDIGAFLNEILGGLGRANDDEEGDDETEGDTKESQQQDAQAAS